MYNIALRPSDFAGFSECPIHTTVRVSSQHIYDRHTYSLAAMAPVTKETFCLMFALVYGGFGVTMFNPFVDFFYGADSFIAYYTQTSDFSTFFARIAGLLFITLASGPYVFGVGR